MAGVSDQLAASGKLILTISCIVTTGLLSGCTYSGHSIKAEVGREVGESLKGSVYKVGCEVQFKARANQ